MQYISLAISIVALTISAVTFWIMRIKKGEVKMTRPSVIFFGPDGGGSQHRKIFIRTLLFSSAERGAYVQNMYVKLLGENINQIFNIWVYDDKGLVRGSGLFVDKSGISANHHFLLPKDELGFRFTKGDYHLQVYVERMGRKPRKLYEQELHLTEQQANEINTNDAGVYFDW
ncbi:hypothetical protein, partial [Lewinella cohaerens]|uniref:hypothetical protein n=1 Tax=Lewinella cohaerens TaxID=70995 RepID=UPI0003757A88